MISYGKDIDSEILGSVSVYDFEVYNRDGLLFKTDTVKNFNIQSDIENGNTLEVVDALISYKLLDKISKLNKGDREVRIRGYSIARNPDTGKDLEIRLNISFATLELYEMGNFVGNSISPTLIFSFNRKDAHGFDNLFISLEN